MKPLSLNLSKMKKIGGGKHSSTFQHPDGHQITVAHAGISALQRKQMESLPIHKMADGGDTEQNSSPLTPAEVPVVYERGSDSKDANRSPASLSSDIGSYLGGGIRDAVSSTADAAKSLFLPIANVVGDATSGLISGVSGTPALANVPVTSQPSPSLGNGRSPDNIPASSENESQQPVPSQTIPKYAVDINKLYQQGQNAISEQQGVNAAQAKSDLDIQKQDIEERQALNQKVQDNFNQFNTHQQQFMQDYMNNHIDPKHYQENMSTGQKIATGIGLLFGGMGSATTGQPNLAFEMLNKQIDRDIEGQKSRMDQQKTILGANQALYRDDATALNQTRVNMNDIYDHKIQEAANQLGTPQAKAAADMAHSKFAMENAALLQQNAIRSTVMQHLQQGGQGLNAIDLANAGIIPHDEAIKEQASIDSQRKAIASAQDVFKKYDQEQTVGNLLSPESSRRASAINAELTNLVMESDAAKRLTPESAKLEVQPFFVKTTDDDKTRASKLNGVKNLIRQHAAPTPYMSHFAPQSVPQYGVGSGPELQTRNGVQYQKVPGGWKKVQ